MKLQKRTRLALCSVLEFAAQPARQFSTAELAGRYGASPHHLAKVLGRLRRAGLVSAARGSGGGYRFAGNAKRVTLLEVIALFEKAAANRQAWQPLERALDGVLAEIDATAHATFGSITLQTLLNQAAAGAEAAPGAKNLALDQSRRGGRA